MLECVASERMLVSAYVSLGRTHNCQSVTSLALCCSTVSLLKCMSTHMTFLSHAYLPEHQQAWHLNKGKETLAW